MGQNDSYWYDIYKYVCKDIQKHINRYPNVYLININTLIKLFIAFILILSNPACFSVLSYFTLKFQLMHLTADNQWHE